MNNIGMTYNPELDNFKNLILFPSKHQRAVETLIRVPLPNEEPLLPMQKITILLEEIERANQHIDFYKKENNQKKIEQFLTMKDNFAELIQQVMSESFQVNFHKKAA
jgi:hypothetical protein